MLFGLFSNFHGHDDNFHYGSDHYDPYLHDGLHCDGLLHNVGGVNYVEINNNYYQVAEQSHMDLLGHYEA